jgi:S1-C subfamily serine protease
LQVSTWDGRSLDVTAAAVGAIGDLGVARVNGHLPEVVHFGPEVHGGDRITVAGYPLGGPLTLTHGVVVDRVPGAPFDVPGPVLRITARVEHGNSGGPVLDGQGRVVAIVFAIETATGYGLAIPNDTVRRLANEGGFQNVPACGSE